MRDTVAKLFKKFVAKLPESGESLGAEEVLAEVIPYRPDRFHLLNVEG